MIDLSGKHIVVYTVSLNEYDTVNDIPSMSEELQKKYGFSIEFILYTDSDNVPKGWKRVYHKTGNTRASRYLKINSHLINMNCSKIPDITIYMDSCLKLSNDWFTNLFHGIKELNHYNICRHRHHLEQHMDVMYKLMIQAGRRDVATDILVQKKKYKEVLDLSYIPVTENCFIVRLNNQVTTNINKEWWLEYSITSQRDQISLAYIMNKEWLSFLPFDVRKNEVFSCWCEHNNTKKKSRGMEKVRQAFLKINENKPVQKEVIRPVTNKGKSIGVHLKKRTLKEEKDKIEYTAVPVEVPDNLKVLVSTTYVPMSDDKEDKEFFDITIDSIKKFADRNNYAFNIEDELGAYHHPSWLRLNNKEYLENEFDILIYVDADIYIKEDADTPLKYHPLEGITALDSSSIHSYMKSHPKKRKEQYSKLWKQTFNEDIPFKFPLDRYINAGHLIVPKECSDFFTPPPRVLDDKFFLEQTYLNCRTMDFKYNRLLFGYNYGHIHTPERMEYVMHPNVKFIHFNCPKEYKKRDVLMAVLKKINKNKGVVLSYG